MAKKMHFLFLCTGNSVRSQMAEGFMRSYGGESIDVKSAGTQPVGLNPNAVSVMNEVGIDISVQTSDSLQEKNIKEYDWVITLCGDARDSCPAVPASVRTEHWPLLDPVRAEGSPKEIIEIFRVIRCQIENRVRKLLEQIG